MFNAKTYIFLRGLTFRDQVDRIFRLFLDQKVVPVILILVILTSHNNIGHFSRHGSRLHFLFGQHFGLLSYSGRSRSGRRRSRTPQSGSPCSRSSAFNCTSRSGWSCCGSRSFFSLSLITATVKAFIFLRFGLNRRTSTSRRSRPVGGGCGSGRS